jgi:hypothetical protein
MTVRLGLQGGTGLNTARYLLASAGTNSSFSFWWFDTGSLANTESYNGTTWTANSSE